MTCEGKGILAKEIATLLLKQGNSLFDRLNLFHDVLNANVVDFSNTLRRYNAGSEQLYDVILKIIVGWVNVYSSQATIGVLRAALETEMNIKYLSDCLNTSTYSQFNPGKHICDECIVVEIRLGTSSSDPMGPGGNNICVGSRLIRDFKLKRLLGFGGFGAVLECKNKLANSVCAIKLAPANNSEAEREVKNMVKIPKHPNIITYYDCWKDEFKAQELKEMQTTFKDGMDHLFKVGEPLEVICIQMELCASDMRHWLGQQKTVNETIVVSMFTQIMNGISHLHIQDMMHRDLKPENIFLDINDNSIVKIADFGLGTSPTGNIFHTQCAGTQLYQAPEQITSTYEQSVDIYSAGIILFELLYPEIQPSFNGKSNTRLVTAITELKFVKKLPSEIRDKWPTYSNLILQMVSAIPNERPSCQDILQSIQCSPEALKEDTKEAQEVKVDKELETTATPNAKLDDVTTTKPKKKGGFKSLGLALFKALIEDKDSDEDEEDSSKRSTKKNGTKNREDSSSSDPSPYQNLPNSSSGSSTGYPSPTSPNMPYPAVGWPASYPSPTTIANHQMRYGNYGQSMMYSSPGSVQQSTQNHMYSGLSYGQSNLNSAQQMNGVSCNKCRSMSGNMYVCNACPNFNLCDRCIRTEVGHYQTHPFSVIKPQNMAQQHCDNVPSKYDKETDDSDDDSEDDEGYNGVPVCDECGDGLNTFYHCNDCSDFDFCRQCYQSQAAAEHRMHHSFTKHHLRR